MKKLFITFLAASLVAASAIAFSLPNVDSVQPLRDSMGFIHCTIFSINQKAHLWMTAHHCIADENTGAYIDDFNIGNDTGGVYRDFPEIDVAILEFNSTSAPALKLSKDPTVYGDKIFVMGYGWGLTPPTVFRGRVANPDTAVPVSEDGSVVRHYQMFDMNVWPGHSGSPVMRQSDNKVIAVMQISLREASGGTTWHDLVTETGHFWEN